VTGAEPLAILLVWPTRGAHNPAAVLVRVVTGRVKASEVAQVAPVVRERLPAVRDQPGLVAAHFGRQLTGLDAEFVFVTVWRTAGDMHAWVGADLDHTPLFDGHEEVLGDYQVRHYETLDDALDA